MPGLGLVMCTEAVCCTGHGSRSARNGHAAKRGLHVCSCKCWLAARGCSRKQMLRRAAPWQGKGSCLQGGQWHLCTGAQGCVCVLSGAAQDFVMGTGLIPADGEIWKVRRRAIVPALHRCAPCA